MVKKGLLSIIISLTGFILLLPLVKIFSIHTNYFDLGIFESHLSQIAIEKEWQRAFFGHAHGFALLLFGWLYSFIPDSVVPYILIGIQSILLILPLLLFYRRFGEIGAFVYVTYYPLWVNANFDFHFDHLAVPLLAGFYFCLLYRRISWGVVCAALLMLVKEPFSLQTIACGILLLWLGISGKSIDDSPLNLAERRLLIGYGISLMITGFLFFYFSLHYLIPFFTYQGEENILDSSAFSWLGKGIGNMMINIISNPKLVFEEIFFSPNKLVYLAVIFGLLAFVPLLRPVALIPALPLLAIAMLSRQPNYYDYNTHYTAGLIVPVIFAFMLALSRAKCVWERAINFIITNIRYPSEFKNSLMGGRNQHQLFYILLFVWILSGHILLSPSPISRLFWSDKVWSYSWRAYVLTERDEMIKSAIKKFIPANPDVSVSTQNTVNLGYLAHRKVYLPFPIGVIEPQKMMDWSNRSLGEFWNFVLDRGEKSPAILYNRYADYVVLDLKRPYFIEDRGCEWIYGKCRNKKIEKEFLDWVAITKSIYHIDFEQDGFMILRRK